MLRDLADDEDPVLRTLARATAAGQWIEWRAEDVWPRRTLHRGNVVLVGDAARAGAMSRRSSVTSRAMPEVMAARPMALSGGPVLRRITRPAVAVPG